MKQKNKEGKDNHQVELNIPTNCTFPGNDAEMSGIYHTQDTSNGL